MQYKAHKYLTEIILFPAAINACFSAFPLADVYGFINRKKAVRSAKSGTHALGKRRKRCLINGKSGTKISGVKTFIFSVACRLSAA